MHVIVSGFGSYGDVLPMVGIGAAMRARGHTVQVIVNPYFRSVVEGAGLELLPLGSAEEYVTLSAHPDLWHPHRGLKLVLTEAVSGYLRRAYKLYEEHYRPGVTVLASHGLDLAARVFHEKHAAPMASVHFAPFAILTLHETPRYIGAPSMVGWPRWLKAVPFWAADRWIIDPIVGPTVNGLRGELGMPAVKNIFSKWNHSPQLVLGMWPEWFGPPQPDWPPAMQLAGFPLWDPRAADGAVQELPAECEEFLQAGAAPIVFAPGSANVQAHEFFRTAVAVCERLGRRGILATKCGEQLPKSLPASVRHFTFVPFSALLPRTAALVHHGGIGTCAQGLACGLPQLVMPMAYDQLDNGLRLKRLGVGDIVPVKKFTPANVTPKLETLLTSPTVQERARHWAIQGNGGAALTRACESLEKLAGARPAGHGQTLSEPRKPLTA